MAWSKEERDYKNGSYERLDLMEMFYLNKEGKVAGFKQWKAIDSVNFGRSYGGKFFGKKPGEYTGRPFQFSNRNETEMLETMVGHYNKMDIIERRAKTTCQAERIAVIGRIHQIRRTEAGCDRLANDIRQLICIGVAQLDQTVLVEIIVRAVYVIY